MGHVGLTSRSPCQILENSYLHSRGNINHWIFKNHLFRVFVLTVTRPCSKKVMKGKQIRSNLRQLLCILVKLRPSNLDHLFNLVCGIEL